MTEGPDLAGFRHVVREHVYDKCWSLDVTWAEVADLFQSGTVIERHALGDLRIKEIRLLAGWSRPLHLVYVIDPWRRIIVFVTIYEPDLAHWQPGFTERRR
jgi:hypothetical protein